jgi:predicted HTH transcriptional regulator
MISAALAAAEESAITAQRLLELPTEIGDAVGGVRANSAVARLLPLILETPAVTAEDVITRTGASSTSAYDAVQRLVDAGVLRPLTDRQRNQVWGSTYLLDELRDLGSRIERRAARSQP